MQALIRNGDFVLDNNNHIINISGIDEIVQEILLSLMIPKGSFFLDKNLGSNLYNLKFACNSDINQEVSIIIGKALENFADVSVCNFECSLSDEKILKVNFVLNVHDKLIDLEVIL
jgi:phage baseplate assembly protein W